MGIHPSATIHPSANISKSAAIGANAVIEAGAVVGDNAQIGPNSFIGERVKIGAGTKLWPSVTIYHDVEIGSDCLFQANSVVGSDGFGYANERGQWLKIPQLGSVIIGDKVEIGASTTIDRGALDNTIIHSNVIIDNQCQIAHNVEVNSGTAIAGCSVLAGSVTIGKNSKLVEIGRAHV